MKNVLYLLFIIALSITLLGCEVGIEPDIKNPNDDVKEEPPVKGTNFPTLPDIEPVIDPLIPVIDVEQKVESVMVTLIMTYDFYPGNTWTPDEYSAYYTKLNNDIMEKYDLAKYKEKCELTSVMQILMFRFEYLNYNETIEQHFESLKQYTEDFEYVGIEKYYPYSSIKLPNINHYTLNYQEVEFNGEYHGEIPTLDKLYFETYDDLKSSVMKEIEEINNTNYTCDHDSNIDQLSKQHNINSLMNLLEKYNEKYFEENILVLSDIIVRGSQSIKVELNNVYIDNNTLYLVVKSYYPYYGDCAMQSGMFYITLPKKYNNQIKNVITLE